MRSNNIYRPGGFATPVSCLLVFRYGNKTSVSTMGTIASWSGEHLPDFDLDRNIPDFGLDRKADLQRQRWCWPPSSCFPAKGTIPTAKSLIVDSENKGKGEGSIHVFVPGFVIDGALIVNIDNEGWTEEWATPPHNSDPWRSPCRIGPALLCLIFRITRGTDRSAKHALTWSPYRMIWAGWGYLNVHVLFQCS